MYIQNNYQTKFNRQNYNPSFGVKINRINFYEILCNQPVQGFDKLRYNSIGKLIDVPSAKIKSCDEVALSNLMKKLSFHLLNSNPEFNEKYLDFLNALNKGTLPKFIKRVMSTEPRMIDASIDKSIQKSLRKEFDLMSFKEKKISKFDKS